MTSTDDRHLISAAEALALARACLTAIGLTAEEAAIVAAHLVDAELVGHEAAGLARIPALAAMPELKQLRRPPTTIRETPISALIAGGNSLGYVAMDYAVAVAIEKVRDSGIAIVGVHDAFNSGRSGYWVERVARAGFAALHAVSTPPLVVPLGAAARGLGTNPLALAFPAEPDPIVVDMATSAASWADVTRRSAYDGVFSEEVGVDRAGLPTAVARDILEGGLRPYGGKGQALAFAIQALGLMVGARRRRGDLVDFGYLLVAFDPGLFGDRPAFERDVADLCAHYLGLPMRPEAEALRIPGLHGQALRRERLVSGLAIPSSLLRALRDLSDRL